MSPIRSHFIKGSWIEGKGEKFASTDPATAEAIFEGRFATSEEVHLAVTAAVNSFENWADKNIADRVSHLEAYRERLVAHKDDLSETISRETGKPLWESATEVDAMIGKIGLSVQAYNQRCGIITTELGPPAQRPHSARSFSRKYRNPKTKRASAPGCSANG
jgi:succinylglutamic semialdehyde dehydrogenase